MSLHQNQESIAVVPENISEVIDTMTPLPDLPILTDEQVAVRDALEQMEGLRRQVLLGVHATHAAFLYASRGGQAAEDRFRAAYQLTISVDRYEDSSSPSSPPASGSSSISR